jgi:cytochrome P450
MLLDKNPGDALSTAVDHDLMQHTLQFLVPNTDSSAVALSAAIFQLIQSSAMRQRIRSELDDYSLNSDDWSSLIKLPFLVKRCMYPRFGQYALLTLLQTAVVKEILRLYPSLPGLLPRVVPAGGYTIGERYLPRGVR